MNEKTTINYEDTVDIVRNAIPRMSELKIPITPSNYAVWYEYLSEPDQALGQEMNVLLKRKQAITNAEINALYESYLEERNEKLRLAKTALGQMVSTLVNHIRYADGHYSSFSTELNDISISLAGEPSAEDLNNLMNRAVHATNAALEQGLELKQKLSLMATEMDTVRGKLARSQQDARTDALTGLHNRMVFQEELAALTQYAMQDSQAPCLLLIDIDFFKRVNDDYGHLTGDHVLNAVAHEIKDCVRGRDMVARYGGEEFVVLLRDTPRSGCQAVAEHVRASIEGKVIKSPEGLSSDESISVTVSIGGSWFRDQEKPETFVERADRSLYLSKEFGRNQVTWES